MKVLSYNIRAGGFSTYKNPREKIPERLPLLQETLKNINADFVALHDTFRWEKTFSEKDLQELFGYKHVLNISMEDDRVTHDVGIAMLTNLPVKNITVFRAFDRNYIKTETEFNDKPLDVFAVYLDDASEQKKVEEVKAVLSQVDLANSSVIAGDLNSLKLEKLPFNRALRSLLRGEALAMLQEAGFKDTITSCRPSFPTKISSLGLFGPLVRLDYVLYKGDLVVREAKILRDDYLNKVSDHFPVVAEFA